MKKIIARKISFFFKLWYGFRYGRRVNFGRRVIVNHKFVFRGKGRLVVGDDVNMWSHGEKNDFYTFDPAALIHIGARSRINGISVQCKQQVIIGEDCLIGSAILIDTDFHSVNYEHRNDSAHVKSKTIRVGDKVWLAGQSAVLKGVTIGDRAVVGFRAVVAKDVPPDTIVAGNPAQEIGKIK